MVSTTACLAFVGASALTMRVALVILSRRAKSLALRKVPGPPSASFLTGETLPFVICLRRDANIDAL